MKQGPLYGSCRAAFMGLLPSALANRRCCLDRWLLLPPEHTHLLLGRHGRGMAPHFDLEWLAAAQQQQTCGGPAAQPVGGAVAAAAAADIETAAAVGQANPGPTVSESTGEAASDEALSACDYPRLQEARQYLYECIQVRKAPSPNALGADA